MKEEIYQQKNIPIFESLYGKGLISLGGYQAVDRLFDGVALRDKHLLDIGSGIGGMAHYLASHYHALVTGLEINLSMSDFAKESTEHEIKDRVNFITYNDDGSIPLKSASIDIVYSKGVLTNVKDKQSLFKEIARVMKPGGAVYLVDWLMPEDIGPSKEILSTGEASYKETRKSYQAILTSNRFQHIEFKDVSDEYLIYAQDLKHLLCSDEHTKKYSEVLSPSLRELLQKSNTHLINSIKLGHQFSVCIHAIKL